MPSLEFSDAPEVHSRYRWIVLIVLWLTLILSYFDRVAIAAALPFMSSELGLSASVAVLVTGALFLSYTLVQVPAGWVTDRWGQRRFIAAAITWWTVFSVRTGVAASSLVALICVRLLMGAGEGFHPPPLWRMLSNWFGPGRRSWPLALMLTALPLGPALAPKIVFPVIASFGWRWVFYGTAIPGILVAAAAWFLLRDTPQRKDFKQAPTQLNPNPSTSAHRRLRRPPHHVILAFLAFFFFGFVLYGLMGWLPTYLLTYRHLNIKTVGWIATTPYIAGAVGLLAGAWVCEKYFHTRRRWFIATTYVLAAACVATVPVTGSVPLAGLALTLSGFFLYAGLGPFWSVPMDLVAPGEVGTWLGFINMGTQLSGFLGPIFIGWLIEHTGSFNSALISMVASLILAAIILAAIRDRKRAPATNATSSEQVGATS